MAPRGPYKKRKAKEKEETRHPLAVAVRGGDVLLLYKVDDENGNPALFFAPGRSGTLFSGKPMAVSLVYKDGRPEDLSLCHDFRFFCHDGDCVMTYVRDDVDGPHLSFAVSEDRKRWVIGGTVTKVHKGAVLVPELEEGTGHRIYYEDFYLRIAHSKNLSTWGLVETLRVPSNEFSPERDFKLIGAVAVPEGILVLYGYFLSAEVISETTPIHKIMERRFLKMGAALFGYDNPDHLLKNFDLPLFESPFDHGVNARLLGVVATKTKKIKVFLSAPSGEVGTIEFPLERIFTPRSDLITPLAKHEENPILSPSAKNWWESEATFNPAAVYHDGKVYLFYRALGRDGISRIGVAVSTDGVTVEDRLPQPVFVAENEKEAKDHHPFTSPARLKYNQELNPSGGGWGGCEDPRAVKIDGRVYVTFNMFNGWDSMRVAFTSIDEKDLSEGRWLWDHFKYISRPGDRQKNWMLFPEKIGGKFALLHSIYDPAASRVQISYLDRLGMEEAPLVGESPDPQRLPDQVIGWHNRTRSAAAPPIKTKYGWLLFYHAMDKNDPGRYKVGAMLLDKTDPSKILYRSPRPVLSPDEWYENDWKPGIVYASGAVVLGDDLIVYYGGGDKHVAAARANLPDFLGKLTHHEHAMLRPVKG